MLLEQQNFLLRHVKTHTDLDCEDVAAFDSSVHSGRERNEIGYTEKNIDEQQTSTDAYSVHEKDVTPHLTPDEDESKGRVRETSDIVVTDESERLVAVVDNPPNIKTQVNGKNAPAVDTTSNNEVDDSTLSATPSGSGKAANNPKGPMRIMTAVVIGNN